MKKLLLVFALIISANGFSATTPKDKQEIKHLLEMKVPKAYILVLKGQRKLRELLDGPELNKSEKAELKEFVDSPVPRRIIPLVRGNRSLDELGLRKYYENAKAEAAAGNL